MTGHKSLDRDVPLKSEADLVELFHESEKPESEWRIGAEAEKFGIDAESGAPLQYAGERGVLRLFSHLVERHGWQPEVEAPGGPVVALRRGAESITLEPGAQFELSGAPLADIHAVQAESQAHLAELAPISRELNLVWLGIGFHPFARQDDLPWVPKRRYPVMKHYLPPRGAAAWDMMRRTATVQANFDYANEEDAMRKLIVSLRLSPLLHAMTANAPLKEGRPSEVKSLRGEVWLHMDPQRSGLIPALWNKPRPTYHDYVEWALDAGMFLFKRGEQVIENSGQSFRSFMRDGYQGHRARFQDWRTHINTLFPEVRLKTTLELRSCDAQPLPLLSSVAAVQTGFLYDSRAMADAEALARRFDYDTLAASREDLVRRALDAKLGEMPVRDLALELVTIARAGLSRRGRKNARGEDESIYLLELERRIEHGQTSADLLLAGDGSFADVVAKCRLAP
jgi:glutamate--cysteine ligase